MKKNLLFLLVLVLIISGCADLKKVQTRELMGTTVTITTYDDSDVEPAFKEIERIDNLLSNYNNKSEVYLLNKQGHIEDPSIELTDNTIAALYYSNLSSGAFDITVQPILDLYTYAFSNLQRPPTAEEINKTKVLVNYKNIFTKKGLILLRVEGMEITLGGIAKGYAIDKAIDELQRDGVEEALVNAGGDMRAIGDRVWNIALQNPRNKQEYITIIELKNKAVATSGDYERYFEENKSFHHIVDPRTGYSATDLISVTVIADTAMDADALATSVFVMGKDGLRLIESLDNVEALIITKEKEIIKSSGFS